MEINITNDTIRRDLLARLMMIEPYDDTYSSSAGSREEVFRVEAIYSTGNSEPLDCALHRGYGDNSGPAIHEFMPTVREQLLKKTPRNTRSLSV